MPGSRKARVAKAPAQRTRKSSPPALAVTGRALRRAAPAWIEAWRPKRRIPLSVWSRANARLPDGSRYKAFPFQDAIADAFTQPGVTQISCRKSSRIGWSQILQNLAGYCIDQVPRRVLIYQPTIDDAENYAKDDLGPVFEWPAVRKVVRYKPRDPRNQIRAKRFPGGWIQIKGANSPKEFRRVTADWVLCEEPDGYPQMAGREGDPVALAYKRNLTSDDPMKAAGSTPTIKGASAIGKLFDAGTQEYRYVPCPHCGLMQPLVFGDGTGAGIRWEPKDTPTRAYYRCEAGCDIEEDHKAWMDGHGEFRASAPQNFPHRSFQIWAAYSQFPGAAWLEIAKEFLDVRHDPNRLMVFKNQVLGLEWEVKGEAPAWRRLYDRREGYRPGIVPHGGLMLTAGIDVQKDRIEVYVWAWGVGLECWLIDHLVIDGNPFLTATWAGVTAAVQRSWAHENGPEMRLYRAGVDTGYATVQAMTWAKKHPGLVIAVKGATKLAAPVFAWSDVREAAANGGKRKRGQRLGMVGGHVLTLHLYGLLHLDGPTEAERTAGQGFPAGYVHLSHLASEEVCKQMVGDQWVEDRGEWKKVHATEALDGWKYARAVASAAGADRWPLSTWRSMAAVWQPPDQPTAPPPRAAGAPAPTPSPTPAPPSPPRGKSRVGRSGYLSRIGR